MNVFLIADLHLSHKGIVKFLREDGVTKERPWDNTEDMDAALIDNWNNSVKEGDRVYVLGDVVINRKAMPLLGKLNGTKILIAGNHDVMRTTEYLEYFKEVKGSGVLANMLLTHIPVHPASLERWDGNFHGHLHSKSVMGQRWYRDDEGEWNYAADVIDPRYLCLSAEHVSYTPIPLEGALARFKAQQ